jgi:hypothetical protein
MALQDIELELSDDALPSDIRTMIDESDRRIDALFENDGNLEVPRYMPSDPEVFFRTLTAITERNLPLGHVFCEWGCGYGICACIAAKLGYEAYGIERDPKMVKRARSLAHDLNVPVEIVETSYVPEGRDFYDGVAGPVLIKQEGMVWPDDRGVPPASYDGMDRDLSEVDVFFVYPWPQEQDFMRELFDAVAAEGAILIAFHKSGEILASRKVCDEQAGGEDQ